MGRFTSNNWNNQGFGFGKGGFGGNGNFGFGNRNSGYRPGGFDFRNSAFDFRNWKMNFNNWDIVSKFIYFNIGVFVFVSLVNLFLMLFGVPANPWMKYLQLPSWLPTLFLQPWSIISYMFLHVGLFHLIFNMMWLFWFGRLFLNFFSSKHFRGLYFLGGIYGGLSFVLAYNILPGFEASLPTASLLGASASVLAIVIATAVREPNYPVQFMFLGSVRLKYVALCMIAFDLLFISYNNAGGHIAHLGGAVAGWLFADGLTKGKDRTGWVNKAIDFLLGKVKFQIKPRKPKMKVHYGDRQQDYEYNARKKEREQELDEILDKLRKSGYANLTDDEKRRLFDASKK